MDRVQWVLRHYDASASALDADAFVRGLAPDVRMTRGLTAMTGRGEIRRAVERMRDQGLLSIRHDIVGLWEPEPGVVIAEAVVTYRHETYSTRPVPVVTVFRWRGDEVADIRIHMDSSQVSDTSS
ncbi:nuclear transport factor 2 family protein [Streptomyces sp. NPDC002143]